MPKPSPPIDATTTSRPALRRGQERTTARVLAVTGLLALVACHPGRQQADDGGVGMTVVGGDKGDGDSDSNPAGDSGDDSVFEGDGDGASTGDGDAMSEGDAGGGDGDGDGDGDDVGDGDAMSEGDRDEGSSNRPIRARCEQTAGTLRGTCTIRGNDYSCTCFESGGDGDGAGGGGPLADPDETCDSVLMRFCAEAF